MACTLHRSADLLLQALKTGSLPQMLQMPNRKRVNVSGTVAVVQATLPKPLRSKFRANHKSVAISKGQSQTVPESGASVLSTTLTATTAQVDSITSNRRNVVSTLDQNGPPMQSLSPPQLATGKGIHLVLCAALRDGLPAWWITRLPLVINKTLESVVHRADIVDSTSIHHMHDSLTSLAHRLFHPEHIMSHSSVWLGKVGHIAHLLHRAESGRPVRVLVLGGSITAGANCIPPGQAQQLAWRPKYYSGCAWPTRLADLAATLGPTVFGGAPQSTAVDIQHITFGGATSETGEAFVLRHKMWPKVWNGKGPHIIVNAFSSNDMNKFHLDHGAGRVNGSSTNMTVDEMRKQFVESFIRTVVEECDHPLLLLFNDYFGNEWGTLSNEIEGQTLLSELASHYNLPFVNYAGLLRRQVLEDPKEAVWGPNWFTGKGHSYVRQVHPGWKAHIAMTWVLAWNVMHAYEHTCHLAAAWANAEQGLPDQQWVAEHQDVHAEHHQRIPARLYSASTHLRNVSFADCKPPVSSNSHCAVHWHGSIDQDTLPVVTSNIVEQHSGWVCDGDHRKWGWRAMERGAMIIFRLPPAGGAHSPRARSKLELEYLRSFGSEWGTVLLQAHVSMPDKEEADALMGHQKTMKAARLASVLLNGQGGQAVSVSKMVVIEVPEETLSISLNLTLINGSSWKLQGMKLCSVLSDEEQTRKAA